MLRVFTPSGYTSPCGKSPSPLRQSNESLLRQQIIDMVQQQTDEETKAAMMSLENSARTEESAVIYQLKKKSGIAPIKPATTKAERQNENLKRMHLKVLRETRGKTTRTFPALDDIQLSIRDNIENGNTKDPYKRPFTGVGSHDNSPKSKTVRFKIEVNPNLVPQSSNGNGSDDKSPDKSYEIRGNAIKNNQNSKTIPITNKRNETVQRQNDIHNSLQLFKRRLQFNNESFHGTSKHKPEDDYIIRRVPLRLENPSRSTLTTPSSLVEPRLQSASSILSRPKTPVNMLSASKNRPKSTESTGKGENQEKTIKCSYRLPDNPNWGKEVSFRDDTETIPNVGTYVVEQGKRKTGKYEHPATLSTHNVGVHNALTTVKGNKVKIADGEVSCDPRFMRWLEESSANSYQSKLQQRTRSSLSAPERIKSPTFSDHCPSL